MPFLALFIPSALQCLKVAGPVASVFGLVWLARHGQGIVERIFPHWQWERQLGWLNLRAYRRAENALRWIGHFGHAVLLLALAGILGNASFFGHLDPADGPVNAGVLLLHAAGFLGCLALWLIYLAAVLAPKIRDEYERVELERFRAENPDAPAERPAYGMRGAGGITIWDSPVASPIRRR